ncbi:FprA family A-type flavoprotein [Orenia marismortui]|uniref:Flavorubredoxin n=1 Tax=Orenia marismortui TaxID=46469 RepID=A0A4R8H0Y0_9FIRM|nr:FprA family A-type flavoprotein [Orenia marismortui]TDX53178.1 flavorubredoxin [Orenia marismortui]
MSNIVSITDDIYWIGVNDRSTELFEAIWPLPSGVSYNSYLIEDDKVAVIDTVKNTHIDSYLLNIKDLLGEREVDYLIINHIEPDHSGAIKAFKEAYPEITIVGNKKTIGLLEGFYKIVDNVKIIGDGDHLELGEHKLNFHLTPMVHWPETMMTYDSKDKILFSGDAFGGFGTLDGGIFDDEVNIEFYEDEIRRYFSNIIGKYTPMVQRAISKLDGLDIEVVASTHGPIWRDNPQRIIDDYSRWSKQDTEEGVVIVYGSMYGNTEKLVESVARNISKEGIKNIRVYNISTTHVSYIINDIWKYEGLILASCSYNTGIFPPMDYLLRILENKNLKNHSLGIIGSYSWSGGALSRLEDFAAKSGCDFIDPAIEMKCSPDNDDFDDAKLLAKNIAEKLKE